MQRLSFEKYQGLGNDFLVVHHDDPDSFEPSLARQLCDRHFGVGGDGVLLVSPPKEPNARARMTVINADGSRPEMCGNGLRCVALHVARNEAGTPQRFVIETDAGPRHCVVEPSDGGAGPNARHSRADVTTSMGAARLEGSVQADFAGQTYRFERVSMGNPHAIRFAPPETLPLIDEVGPLVSSQVSGGLNVEFATLRNEREIDVVVWERGVGRTLACGTGAAATAVAAAVAGISPFDAPLTVRLPGGPLVLVVARDTLEVQLRGPAQWVFTGEWSTAA